MVFRLKPEEADKRLEQWENNLLDLSMRNRLLNLPMGSRGGSLDISEPGFEHLWGRLVDSRLSVTFPLRTRADYRAEQTEYDLYQSALRSGTLTMDAPRICKPKPFELKEGEAVANSRSDDMRRRLKSIRSRSKLLLEERGIEALYVVFGLLKWTDKKKQGHRAPLLLFPVDIKIKTLKSPYVIGGTGDVPVHNVTLAMLLKQDYDIDLPTFTPGDSATRYLASVASRVRDFGWTVEPGTALGVFSFATINMYYDLKENGGIIMSNPAIRAICGEEEAAARLYDNVIADDDEVKHLANRLRDSGDYYQVVDADSSQAYAIELANAGYSFRLQGPPGTGKSQTITNIISESLARGKKVLFVSEKRAALEVVRKRLSDAGLGDFLFVLHDPKTKKKDAIKDLARQLSLWKSPRRSGGRLDVRRLASYRDEIDEYARQVTAQIDPLGCSPWEAYDRLVELRDAPQLQFDLEHVETISKNEYEDMLEAIADLSALLTSTVTPFRENPWRGLKPNRFTEDYAARVMLSASQAADAIESLADITEKAFGVPGDDSIESLDYVFNRAKLMQKIIALRPVDRSLIFSSELRRTTDAIASIASMLGDHKELWEELKANVSGALTASAIWQLNQQSAERLESSRCQKCRLLSEEQFDFKWGWLRENVIKAQQVQEELLEEWTSDLFNLDVRHMLVAMEQQFGSGVKRLLSSEYKGMMNQIAACKRAISSERLTYEDAKHVLHQVDSLIQIEHELDDHASIYKELFGALFQGTKTDLPALERELEEEADAERLFELSGRAEKLILDNGDAISVVDEALGSEDLKLEEDYCLLATDCSDALEALNMGILVGADAQTVKLCCVAGTAERDRMLEASGDVENAICCATDACSAFVELFRQADDKVENSPRLVPIDDDMDCRLAVKLLRSASADERMIREAQSVIRQIDACDRLGLSDFIHIALDCGVSAESYRAAFEHRFLKLWIDRILLENKELDAFSEPLQTSAVEEYCNRDEKLVETAKDRVYNKLIQGLEGAERTISGGVLQREASKKTHVISIRRLFEEHPELVMKLKPCLMMSPLSVSTFLSSRSIQFDLIVFDEASQVCTENAVGAISRGKQVIIAGDSEQLPPTDFFTASLGEIDDVDGEDDENEPIGAFDSVLDEASMLRTCSLSWHYRSRNESLISFSNHCFYDDDLVTFPSNHERKDGEGVSFEYVEAGRWVDSRVGNPVEAQRVAEIVFEHFREYPHRSLGVIAFGNGHARAIERAITKMRERERGCEHFFDESVPEPFFVKSLENVQGDERDSIILSVGYGRSASDEKVRMSFGPINRRGGERRLNVAVTRAKCNLVLVSSLLDSDFTLGEDSANGPQRLRDYIAYARNISAQGGSAQVDGNGRVDGANDECAISDFIANELERLGYSVDASIGDSSCAVDLGVKRSPEAKEYILGLSFDGPRYASVQSTRDRERIRPNVLEGMGWTLYRVWAQAWGRDPKGELQKLVAALHAVGGVATSGASAPGVAAAVPVYKEKAVAATTGRRTEERSEAASSMVEPMLGVDETSDRAVLSAIRGSGRASADSNPKQFLDYIAADQTIRLSNLEKQLYQTARIEAPVSYERLYDAARDYLELSRATEQVRQQVKKAFTRAAAKREFEVRGGFVYLAGQLEDGDIELRLAGPRTFSQIAPKELEAGILATFYKMNPSEGVSPELLRRQTYLAFGFARMHDATEISLKNCINRLVKRKKIILANGALFLPEKE